MIEFTPSEIALYYSTRVPKLRQRGSRRWAGPCPVHGGRDHNFSVEAQSGRWFCFSQCQRGGDVFKLEQELTGTGFVPAKRTVFAVIGRSDPFVSRTSAERREYARRRALAEADALALVEWREDAIARLEALRNDHLGAYHRALRFIDRHGIESARGQMAADVVEAAGARFEALDIRLDEWRRMPWAELLKHYRAREVAA
jgi:hypothetical protein